MRHGCVTILVTCAGMGCFHCEETAQNRFLEDKQSGLGFMAILGSGEGTTSHAGFPATTRHGFDLNLFR